MFVPAFIPPSLFPESQFYSKCNGHYYEFKYKVYTVCMCMGYKINAVEN